MTLSEADSSLVGEVLDDRYEILEVIGDGGVGVVYRARRVKLERTVAIKVLRETHVEDAGFVGRFQREAVTMSRLYHPHCVAVIDFGVYDARPYLVLEHVPGQTVTKLLAEGPLSAQRATNIALQLLEALAYFHSHHVIHRDLKSENVMLVEPGIKDFVKVLDFGMAKILEGPGADSQLSILGLVPGTPSVMAPEQIQQLPPDPRIDIYATGILLYEMIVGRRPFRGADMATVIKMQVSAPPQPPRQVLGDNALSRELEEVMLKALEKDRLDRYATAAEMAAALRATPEGRTVTATPGDSSLPAPAPRRSSSWKWFLLAAGAASLAAGAFAAVDRAPAPPPRPAAAAAPPPPMPEPPPVPPPEPVVQTWLAHRDLAVTYSGRGQHDDAFREVQSAVTDDPAAAGADPPLAEAAVRALSPSRVAFVVNAFRDNPRLIDALAETTATAQERELRGAALGALRELGQEQRADLVAMQLLDLEQAQTCAQKRAVYKQLRKVDDPRVDELTATLRRESRTDRDLRCMKRVLR